MNTYADFDGLGTLATRYLHDPAIDALLARTSSAGDTAWYLTDRLGSVRDIANTSGTVIDHVSYDSFGNILGESNPSAGDRFKYTAREFDPTTGLQSNRARYFQAPTGRWTQPDPIGFAGGDANLYRYVGNDATNATDPTGLLLSGRGRLGGHLDNDPYGRELLHHYLGGHGVEFFRDNHPDWSEYMKRMPGIGPVLRGKLWSIAMDAYKSGRSCGNTDISFPMNMLTNNGEGIIGYQYLNGTDATAGGFNIKTAWYRRIDSAQSTYIYMHRRFRWNDNIDPNLAYDTDTIKSRIASVVTLGSAQSYRFCVQWDSTVKFEVIDPHSPASNDGIGWPFLGSAPQMPYQSGKD
ncbi:MAG: RHS repeat-associated core domain-containing protein [Isosphaeraceae bacterium]|nr:RHS repeat-associated core domain-containing protein [Isosphaeraceae bacterium]